MSALLFGLVSVLSVSLISVVGILTLWLNDTNLRKILLYLVSFSAGSLFGDAFIHLIPEAMEQNEMAISVSILIIFGIFSAFVVERFLQWRHCHIPTTTQHPHSFVYMNLLGDAIHNTIDGLIIGGSYLINIPIGLATTLAVVFHEIPQELGDFGVLVYGGFTKKKALWLNLLTALAAILGASVAFILGSFVDGFIPLLLPFAAGNFIYIAGSDLIPELRKDEPEPKKAALQMTAIALGVTIMALVLLLE
ncbi:ZIP family metal transporter [Candidatus Bathyarchaeota archaeon A05DMB-2]|jgi:zinc and cadmium transporter|nr:ZIP family metal transporter [Candidatus Bathyarchaeota archaeon A05DMB-2]